MKAKLSVIPFVLCLIPLLAACSKGSAAAASLPEQLAPTAVPSVSATGMVMPVTWARVTAQASALVEKVQVVDGDQVEAGQELVRLSCLEGASAALAAAGLELEQAQQGMDLLEANAAARAAQAELDRVAATRRIMDAQKALDETAQPGYQERIRQASADVAREKDQLALDQQNFDKYKAMPETDDTRRFYADALAQQQRDLAAAERVLQTLELKEPEARANLAAGQAQLEVANREIDARQQGPSPIDQLEAQAALAAAKAAQAAAQEAVAQCSLQAPFTGLVSSPAVRVGERVAPGQTLLFLSVPAAFQVETTDLGEIDAVRLHPGDPARVTFDALPDLELQGQVVRVETRAEDGAGANYRAVISLQDPSSSLRWGMTAFVEIAVP